MYLQATGLLLPRCVFIAVYQPWLLINSASPESAGSWASLLSSEERLGEYNGGSWVSEPFWIVNLSLSLSRDLGRTTECVDATCSRSNFCVYLKDRASQSPERPAWHPVISSWRETQRAWHVSASGNLDDGRCGLLHERY